MNTEKANDLSKAVQEARTAYAEAEKKCQEALKRAFDPKLKADIADLQKATRQSAAALVAYAKARTGWEDYLRKHDGRHGARPANR